MPELRSFVVLDSLQEQLASYLASMVQGYMPVRGMGSLFVAVAPGTEIVRLLDIALKATCEAGERGGRTVGEVVSVHIIPRPHTNVDLVLPLGRHDEAAKESG